MPSYSTLQKLRMNFQPAFPNILNNINDLKIVPEGHITDIPSELKEIFPHLKHNPPLVEFTKGSTHKNSPLRVGVVFSGGQAAGGHNVITGLFDSLKKLHPDSKLFGFKNGPKGILENDSFEIIESMLATYRNQGGFDLLGSGRTKIETIDQFKTAAEVMKSLKLDGLVIIGGDDSNTNAALLAEYFLGIGCSTRVVGVPKTIDGDLKSSNIEMSFGFDTACKTYSDIIGNILRDCLSAKKAYYFIKLMGRSASHVTLECALQTHANMTLIGEEVAASKKTLRMLTEEICGMIVQRSNAGKDYGAILIPEGIIEFIPEFKQLISELNSMLSTEKPHQKKLLDLHTKQEQIDYIKTLLSPESKSCFEVIPQEQQMQMLMDRDPHGNVQVSKIETERLFIEMVQKELKKRKSEGSYKGSFSPQPYFCGYEGRSCLPSNFDAQYCYVLGNVAALLVNSNATGYICTVQNLFKPVSEWKIGACNLITMMHFEKRHGKNKPVIKKALVDLHGAPFSAFAKKRDNWIMDDDYCYPGPLQFFGPQEITESITQTLSLESLVQCKVHSKGIL